VLPAEEGRARLQSVRDEQWHAAATKRVRKLKRPLRPLAQPTIAPPQQGYDPEEHEKRQRELLSAAAGLDELKPAQLTAVMEAVHPELGSTLARWWVDARTQPYSSGWTRRAFRAPNHPALTQPARIELLAELAHGAGPYRHGPEWFAAWAPYFELTHLHGPGGFALGPVLAAAVDTGGATGEAVFETLIASGNGEHPIGGMGRHVIIGLLRAGREDGWAFVESLLLAAQRQEGLRQSILEAADEAHPHAFDRIIDLVLRENLLRFAATICAVSVWFGFPEDGEHLDDARKRLEMLRAFRSDPTLTGRRVLEGDAWETYAGLCALAMFDIAPTLQLARQALGSDNRDTRAAAIRFIGATQMSDEMTLPIYMAMTADPDLAVASVAHRQMGHLYGRSIPEDLYPALEALARRLPETPTTADPVGIDPQRVPLDRGPVVATMVQTAGNRALEPMLELLAHMDPGTRAVFVRRIGGRTTLSDDLRRAVVTMVGDRSPGVRQHAVEAMGRLTPTGEETAELEALLTRRAGDLRRGVLGLLKNLPPEEALASAHRLWEGSTAQRDAACELLGEIERTDAVVELAEAFLADSPSATGRDLLVAVIGASVEPTDDPRLGLFDPSELTSPRIPERRTVRRYIDDASLRIIESLDALAEAHRDTPFELVSWQGRTEVLLGDANWLPGPAHRHGQADEDAATGMVLREVFRTWWDERPADHRGRSEPLDALRATVAMTLCGNQQAAPYLREAQTESRELMRPLVGNTTVELRHPIVIGHVLAWVLDEFGDESVLAECVEATEAALALVPGDRVTELANLDSGWRNRERDWRINFSEFCPWMGMADRLLSRNPLLLGTDALAGWYRLMRWYDRPVPGAPRVAFEPWLLHAAHAIGAASDADVYEAFIDAPKGHGWGGRELARFTKRRRSQVQERHPTVVPLADRLRDRVIELERSRGELSTPASHLAFRLASIEGADITIELLARLGRATLVRGYTWNNEGREAVYSRLIQISHPGPEDTPASVAALVDRHNVSDKRLLDLAMFAPQWAPMVEAVLDWDGLEDAVWWFHAHTKDDRWSVEEEVRETWAAMSAERTPLSGADLTDGAVDVEWFVRARQRLGAGQWAKLSRTAKLASGGSGHRRAQLFSEAMLGDLDEHALVKRIADKRHQDSVRAVGLLPLPSDRVDEVALDRYRLLREFERGSARFGQQRQRSESLAVRIGIENLARSTGAPDPQRFIWAMEAAEAGDLAHGPVSVTEDDLTVTLSVDAEGLPGISVKRGDKSLKSVPAKLRKHPPIKELTDRRTALKRQAGRVRRSLEDAMVRQDTFGVDDFAALDAHPVVAPMLELVVWVDDDDRTFRRRDGRWTTADGSSGAPTGAVRLAHPVDLLGSGNWIDWQTQLFDDADRQPFKQVFRELYVLTDTEAADSPLSRRWSGQQVQTRQATALFGSRGWTSDFESSEVLKVFHHAGIAARVTWVDGWGTPAEVELPTIDAVAFTERSSYVALPLGSIPPVVFSETMRDLDLVVSVAHAGGVDPEASASTVEMRAALVRETARLMSLDNVRQESSHVVIEGSLGEYSVHLGSGTVHRRPGGALCIIPVDAQRRGRIFLPFADEDPKTAEVVSKVLMLARDSTIRDPTILEQLRS
jgi:hypothetical protein